MGPKTVNPDRPAMSSLVSDRSPAPRCFIIKVFMVEIMVLDPGIFPRQLRIFYKSFYERNTVPDQRRNYTEDRRV